MSGTASSKYLNLKRFLTLLSKKIQIGKSVVYKDVSNSL